MKYLGQFSNDKDLVTKDTFESATFAKVYKSIAEVSSSLTTTSTITDVVNAMVDNSYLMAEIENYTNLVPSSDYIRGVLEINKVKNNFASCKYIAAINTPSANRYARIWFGEFNNNPVLGGWTGWKELAQTTTIPTVNNSTITFTQGGTTKGTITLNQSSDATIALDAGGGSGVQSDWNVSDSTSMAYILNKPTIPTTTSQLTNNGDGTNNFATTDMAFAKVYKSISEISDTLTTSSTMKNVANAMVDNSYLICSISEGNADDTYSNLSPSPDYNFGLLEIVKRNKNRCAARYTAILTGIGTTKTKMWFGEFQQQQLYTWSGWKEVAQVDDLATVATSGSYADLLNTPTIPTVNDSTITFTQGGVTKGTITLNQSSAATIAFDAGGGGGSGVQSDWNETDTTSEAYILNKPDLTTKEDVANKVTSLSANSTDTQYPSAKCVYDLVGDIDTILTQLNSGQGV